MTEDGLLLLGGGKRRGGDGNESDATVSQSSSPEGRGAGAFAAAGMSDESGTESEDDSKRERMFGSIAIPGTAPGIFQEGRAEWEKESHRMHELWEHDQKAWLAASKIVWRDLRSKRSEEVALATHKRLGPSVDIKTVKASMESSRVAPKRRAEPESSNAKAAPAKKLKKPRAPKLRGGGLKLLMQEQLIQPGVGVLRISYMDVKHEADLNADGLIYYRGDKFSSPSAWSIHVKRLANPSKKADDGWKSVRYVPSGKTLEHYKSQLEQNRAAAGGGQQTAAAVRSVPVVSKPARAPRAAALRAAAAAPPPVMATGDWSDESDDESDGSEDHAGGTGGAAFLGAGFQYSGWA